MELKVPVATLINNPITERYVEGANGRLFLHTRIKTFYKFKNNKQGDWYHGTIIELLDNNKCKIEYDKGFTVEGNANVVFTE